MIIGAERELVIMSAALTGGLALIVMNPVAWAYALAVWPLLLMALRMMAKSDPLMSKVFLRNRQYAAYYPPRSLHWRED